MLDARDEAVSDVLGSILLVGITVAMTVVLALLLFAYDGPEATPRADLAVEVSPGAGGWGSGDEQVLVRHLGGDPLRGADTLVAVRVGDAVHDREGTALGGAFADGSLAIGETWALTVPIAADALVTVNVVGGSSAASTLLASVTLTPLGA